MNTIQIEYPKNLPDYELLDSGNGEKMEKFSGYTIIRPDPRAIWHKSLAESIWIQADAQFLRTNAENGLWKTKTPPPKPWIFRYKNCTFLLKPTNFKHVGIFPEQAVNWDWMTTQINRCHPELACPPKLQRRRAEGSPPSIKDSRIRKPLTILNLFAYTGASTAVAAKNNAFVTHVDSVKSTISWANENCKLNNIPADRVRWIEDDAYKFVVREKKREKTYDAIIMDPPRFGRGSHGEIWKLEDDLPKLLAACKQILSPHPMFILINAYTADLSSLVLSRLMHDFMKGFTGAITFGELATKESSSGRFLPQGIFARWQC
jgi:23S rRNA (cytosine1962-C5)-methyltransferase